MGGGKEIGLSKEPNAWIDVDDHQVPSFHFR